MHKLAVILLFLGGGGRLMVIGYINSRVMEIQIVVLHLALAHITCTVEIWCQPVAKKMRYPCKLNAFREALRLAFVYKMCNIN